MLRVGADHTNNAFAVDHLALVAHFFNRCPYFHVFLNTFVIRPRVRSYGESSTSTRSPGRSRTKFVCVIPAVWAVTISWFESLSRHVAFGISSTTSASTSVTSRKSTRMNANRSQVPIRVHLRSFAATFLFKAESTHTARWPSQPHNARSEPRTTHPS